MINELERFVEQLPQQFKLDDYGIIAIPENVSQGTMTGKWQYPADSIGIHKMLGTEAINFAGPKETTISDTYIDRRSVDFWAGAYWVLCLALMPVMTNVLSSFISDKLRKNVSSPSTVHLTLYLGKGNISKLEFHGDSNMLSKIIKTLAEERRDTD